MVLMDQILDSVRAESGQILLPLGSFSFTDDVLDAMFRACVHRYEKSKPHRKFATVVIPASGYEFTDPVPLAVLKMYPYSTLEMSRRLEAFDPKNWEYRAPMLYSAMIGSFSFEGIYPYTIATQDVEYIETTLNGESTYTLRLLAKFNDTVEFRVGNGDSAPKLVYNKVNWSGTLGSAVISGSTYKITFNTPQTGPLYVKFKSLNPGVSELTRSDYLFYDLFKARFMMAFGKTKAMTKIEGMPMDITVDDVYSMGNELWTKTEEKLDNSQNWWDFR